MELKPHISYAESTASSTDTHDVTNTSIDRTALNYANIFGYKDDLILKGQQFKYLAAMVYARYFFVRFIMGLFEAAVTPGLTLMTGFWYKRSEIPLRQCIWYSSLGWGGIVGSQISMGISGMPTTTRPARWEVLFHILGGVTMIWSFLVYFVLADVPSNARFFSHREKLIAVHRVAGNDTGIKNKRFDKEQAAVAFWGPKAILLFISVFAAAIPNGAVNSFSTTIIKDMGFLTTWTTELKLVCFWLVNAQSVGFTVSLVTISSNMGGYTHRALANAFVFTAYCWGNFAGPFVVKPSQAPRYTSATTGLLVGYAIKTVCHLLLLAYLIFMNMRRRRKYGLADAERSHQAGMMDKTEFENKDFRYVL
ncbi:hypothetical protein B0A50_03529 [Salinomyces thailandicus]|uniref:Allantoate permease n=1 Tax=Salinomyces thailandicus TaxID=706561 RepID=A0A4U0U528_9PEZI|nr:hypothetical protein B0A50_03529 [Salinomyces thailandica]